MLAGNSSPRTWLILTILVSFIILSETVDIKKSKPSSNQRAEDSSEKGESKKGKSFSSDSDSDDENKKDGNNDNPKSAETGSDSNEESNVGGIHSTRGLKAEDFEPEDAKINLKANHNSDDETDGGGDSSRRRRSIGSLNFENVVPTAR